MTETLSLVSSVAPLAIGGSRSCIPVVIVNLPANINEIFNSEAPTPSFRKRRLSALGHTEFPPIIASIYVLRLHALGKAGENAASFSVSHF